MHVTFPKLYPYSIHYQLSWHSSLLIHDGIAKAYFNKFRLLPGIAEFVIHRSSCRENWLNIVKILIEKRKVDVNTKDGNGYTPIHIALL